MFSKNREQIPENLSKKTCFDLLEGIGLTEQNLTDLDSVLVAYGFFNLQEIKSAMVIGSNTLSVSVVTNTGTGSFQFNKLERLKTIDVTYIPTGATVGSIQQIMRIDMSVGEEEAVAALASTVSSDAE